MTRDDPPPSPPKKPRQRRKEARPGEIIDAAIEVFCERGFGAAKLEEVARRAGVAKGTVFVYFPTKPDLSRAVARSLLENNLGRLQQQAPQAQDMPLADLIAQLLVLAAGLGETRIVAIARLMIAESRTFPDLARLWHDEVVAKTLGLLTAAIERAQARGEVRAGDPRLYALSAIGPMVMGLLFHEVFAETGAALPDLRVLARQHAQVVLEGMQVRV